MSSHRFSFKIYVLSLHTISPGRHTTFLHDGSPEKQETLTEGVQRCLLILNAVDNLPGAIEARKVENEVNGAREGAEVLEFAHVHFDAGCVKVGAD